MRDGRAILTPVARQRLPSSEVGTERLQLLARTHGAPGTFTPREPRTRIAPTPHGSQRAPFQPGSKAHSLEYRLIKAASLKACPIAKTICTLGGPARSPNVQRAGRQRGIRMGRRSGRRGNGCGLPRCELHPGGGGWTGGLLTVLFYDSRVFALDPDLSSSKLSGVFIKGKSNCISFLFPLVFIQHFS